MASNQANVVVVYGQRYGVSGDAKTCCSLGGIVVVQWKVDVRQ